MTQHTLALLGFALTLPSLTLRLLCQATSAVSVERSPSTLRTSTSSRDFVTPVRLRAPFDGLTRQSHRSSTTPSTPLGLLQNAHNSLTASLRATRTACSSTSGHLKDSPTHPTTPSSFGLMADAFRTSRLNCPRMMGLPWPSAVLLSSP